jgi:VCBS repeat-containing protein|tara:strand:+ start:2679 stop:3134 length:456 start_codon:yes stop_codon:yes gene_type:complete
MAITQAMCTSFKQELLVGTHNFTNSSGDTFKLALYAISGGGKSGTTATLGAATTAFTTTGEIANSGSYSSGGGSLTNVTPTTSGTTAFTDFADLSFTTATITARGALIYNSSDSNKAVCALDFGGDKTSTAGTFTIQFPTANASNAIIRIA